MSIKYDLFTSPPQPGKENDLEKMQAEGIIQPIFMGRRKGYIIPMEEK